MIKVKISLSFKCGRVHVFIRFHMFIRFHGRMWTTYMFNRSEGNHTPEHFDVRVHNFLKDSMECESVTSPSYCAFKPGFTPVSAFSNVSDK